jgi:ribosomal protein S18 acetylase RimI-like enzyme
MIPEQSDVGLLALLRPLSIADRELMARAVGRMSDPISDHSFASLLCWSEPLMTSCAEIEGHLCVFSHADGDLSMLLPPVALDTSASPRLRACVAVCFDLMDAVNASGPGLSRSRIEYVSDEMLDAIRAGGVPDLSASPMPGDYVYPRRAMVELAGGPLKNKRKLRSRFLRENPDVTTARLTRGDIPECIELLGLWREAGDARHEGEANERLIGTDILRSRDEVFTRAMLERAEELGLKTMVVRSGGRLVGFTIGEMLTPTMAVVHVEKTHPGSVGAAQFIFSEFCRTELAGAEEINAGDDWGIPSLRFTKSSYRPTRLLSKSVLTRQPVPDTGAVEGGVVRTLTEGRRARATAGDLAGSGALIRDAGRDDARRIARVEQGAFDEDDRFSMRQIQRLIVNPRARVLVAEIEGEVIGWSVTLIRSHRRWRSGRVYSVAVDPAHGGKGVGRDLLARAVSLLEEDGISRIYLEVREENLPAIGLYRSVGFEVLRRLGNYYGPGVSGLRMRRVEGARGVAAKADDRASAGYTAGRPVEGPSTPL